MQGKASNGVGKFHEFLACFRVIAYIQLVLACDLLQMLHFFIQGIGLPDHFLPMLGVFPFLASHTVEGYFQQGVFG